MPLANAITRVVERTSAAVSPSPEHHRHGSETTDPEPLFAARGSIRDFGGAEGNRTPDLFDANEARYQLRYSPKRDKDSRPERGTGQSLTAQRWVRISSSWPSSSRSAGPTTGAATASSPTLPSTTSSESGTTGG